MAASSGIGAIAAANVAADILGHLTPTAAAVATAVVITGPLKVALLTTVSTNQVVGTECTDANYTRAQGSITAWNAITTTAGAGYQVGFAQRTSNVALTYGGGTGFAAAQTITGVAFYSSDATPVLVVYQNFAVGVAIPLNNNYVVASGSASVSLS